MELQKIAEEAKNMNLSTQNANRLEITFGENAKKILNTLEIEIKGSNLALNAHYDSLPFQSKNLSYWGYIDENKKYILNPSSNIKNDFHSWCAMLGIKYAPDQLQWDDLKDCLINDLSIHNEESIKLAIRMNLKQDTPIEPFGLINRVFLTKIIVKYEIFLKEANKRAIEIREKLKPKIELTESEIEDKMVKSIHETFLNFKARNENSIEFIASPICDYLQKRGIELVSNERKKELMDLARIYLNGLKDNPSLIPSQDELIPIAKRMAVRDYFNSITKLEF